MKRTQLYLDDDLWQALHAKAALDGTSISELVRVAARDRYLGNLEKRREAMMGIVGLWKDRTDLEDTETMVRRLRAYTRMERLGLK
ncbi:MAG TPA: CopG family transcriptional regulator [Terracidiphilus sp.]|nr:CopG family transcriptional regulator [Terracidiphilus sp.]